VLEAGQVVITGSPDQLKIIPGHHQEFLGGVGSFPVRQQGIDR
jgi:hypothetical protein